MKVADRIAQWGGLRLSVAEYFYSLQGEGARAGSANIFIRLSGCSAKYACYNGGVSCDTEFASGTDFRLEDLRDRVAHWPCRNIIWTGGEPLDQLTEATIIFFSRLGYYQSIETSGLYPAPELIDYVVVSPKVAEHVVAKNFKFIDELRYVRHAGQPIPRPSVMATHKYISPHFDGLNLSEENLMHCKKLVLQNPDWRLSVQQHKFWNVL